MTIEEIRRRKRELHMTNQMLAEESGIPVSTVAKILGEVTKNPRKDTLRAIEKALFPEIKEAGYSYQIYKENNHTIREPEYIYGSSAGKKNSGLIPEKEGTGAKSRKRKEKPHTVSEYEALPADRRV